MRVAKGLQNEFAGCIIPPPRFFALLERKKYMAGLIIRNGTFYAVYKINGRTVQKSLKIRAEKGAAGRKAEQVARQTATLLEQTARGECTISAAVDAIRSAGRAIGACGNMPSVEEYLTNYTPQASEKTESNRRRCFRVFLDFLGDAKNMRLDAVTAQTCRDFIAWALERVSRGTVGLYRTNIAAAFNRAVEENILIKSPMPRINLTKAAAAVNPELGADRITRKPFTVDELRYMINRFPAPWCNMVLASFMLGGQRLGDICLLKWENIDFDAGRVNLTTQKTGAAISQPLRPALRKCLARLYSFRDGGGDYGGYLFPDMARQYILSPGRVSATFTATLRAHGIIPAADTTPKKGRRRAVAVKSFHSIRHSVVTLSRCNAALTPDMVRAVVGHDSEEIERAYFTADYSVKDKVLAGLENALFA